MGKNTSKAYLGKRLLDLVIIFLFFPFFCLVFLLITFLILVTDHQKPFFTQLRPGKDGKLFPMFKFRTMRNEVVTPLGRVLRAISLDEIPQVINVLLGEMSLIGPRPLLPEYLRLYNERQRLRHHVLPGITGWSQVNGRNSISWKERLELDVHYVRHISFRLDLLILIKTMGCFIQPYDDILSDKFTGNP